MQRDILMQFLQRWRLSIPSSIRRYQGMYVCMYVCVFICVRVLIQLLIIAFFLPIHCSDPSSRMYPWRFLSELAHDFDHIVVKMDNNQYQIEMELLKILAGDPNLLELVDEMFFEYHIRNPPVKEMVAAEGMYMCM